MPVFVVRAATSSRRFGYAGESATDSGESSRCASSPPTAATARPRSTGSSPTWVSRTWRFRAQLDRLRRGEPTNTEKLRPHHQMAHRQRRPDQLPQTLRMGPHPHRRHRGRPDLDRTRRPRPPNTRPTRNLVALISPAAYTGAQYGCLSDRLRRSWQPPWETDATHVRRKARRA